MSVAIVDYGSGNLRSAAKAVERAGRETGQDAPVLVTDKAADIAAAERIVLPGVGAFADCMAGLRALDGVIDALNDAVIDKGRPFLGICVGMQLMADRGREYGVTEGLGWIPGEVTKIAPDDPALKIPHMGWNTLDPTAAGESHPFLAGLGDDRDVYFVHSYAFRAADSADILATTDYGGSVTAVIGRANMVGTQFHPEKSQRVGLTVIGNFLAWAP